MSGQVCTFRVYEENIFCTALIQQHSNLHDKHGIKHLIILLLDIRFEEKN